MIPKPALSLLGGGGPPVLLIHGYGADKQSWLATAPALFSSAQVWALDLPAHGSSSSECGDGTVHALTTCVLSALDDANIDKVHVIGHSLGGRLAMELAVQRPIQIVSLALLSPAGVNEQINFEFLTQFYQANTEHGVNQLLQMLVHDPRLMTPHLAKGVVNYLNKPGIRTSLAKITKALIEANATRAATLSALKNTGIPYTSIWGANDKINSLDTGAIAELGGSSQILDNCGHLPHIEKRTLVNKLLTTFIDEVNAFESIHTIS